MNVREAILKAADHIERNPHLYDYQKIYAPECGTTGCAIGWIGHFLGMSGKDLDEICDAIGTTHSEFYERTEPTGNVVAQECAVRSLRAYADRYHPTSDTKCGRPMTPPTTTAPKYDFESLAQRLAREPRETSGIAA